MNTFLLSFLSSILLRYAVDLCSCQSHVLSVGWLVGSLGGGGDGGFYVCLPVAGVTLCCSPYFIVVCYLFGIVILHFIRNLICSSFHFIVILLCYLINCWVFYKWTCQQHKLRHSTVHIVCISKFR